MSVADKLQIIAGNEAKVYEAGKQAQYDEFWDNFQTRNPVGDYQYAFAGSGWNDTTFKPKYDIVLKAGYGGTYTFWGITVTDLAETLKNQGVKLDTSKTGWLQGCFQNSKTKRIPELNLAGIGAYDTNSACQNMFTNCSELETIDKIISNEKVIFNTSFRNCLKLKNLTIEGVIAQNKFDVSTSPLLSKASITSIINALSSTTSGLTVTLSKTAVVNAFGSETSAEWVTLKNTKSNWTVALA